MELFSKDELQQAADLVHATMPATPQHCWPLLSKEIGATVWVKHENHSPTGAFKIRGGISYIDWLRRTQPEARGICTATRGNHGQSQARAAIAAGLTARIYVPHGNATEKNDAMRAFGADLVEFGTDFDAARQEAKRYGEAENLAIVPAFHRELLRGVATYAYELLLALPDLHTIYVPIGCGSGICGTIAARDALGLKTHIVGVVSTLADSALQSVAAGHLVATPSANTFADGMAVRDPVTEAFEIYRSGAERIIAVTDDEIAAAMRLLFRATHNVAEGAGAAAMAALMQERSRMQGKSVAVILSGGNVDSDMFAQVLAGDTPVVRT